LQDARVVLAEVRLDAVGRTRAACTAAICRASNSERVMMSPFTRTITRSMSSAPLRLARRLARTPRARIVLRRFRLRDGFMVHL
jgi:hypothetical protein